MTRSSRSHALGALASAALLLGVIGCSDAPEEEAADTRAIPPRTPETRNEPRPEEPPALVVRVLDGDTSKPVPRARVKVAGQSVRATRSGVARLAGRAVRTRAKIRVAAKGYAPRTVRVDVGDRPVARVRIWQPSFQWPLYGATAARTQAHPSLEVRPPFRRIWSRHLHGFMEFPAVVWGGVAYVHTLRGWLRAISMQNGRVLWKKRIGSLMASSPAVDPQRGVVVSTSMRPGNVTVSSMATGRTRWRFSSGTAEPSPVIRGPVAYFGATNGNVYALDLDRRRPRWTYRGGSKITSSPALVGNRLYFGDYAGRVTALNARTGQVLWRGSAGTRVYGTVAVAGGRVFAPSVGSGLSALSARTGRLLWRIPTGSYLYSSPAVYRGRVYFGTHGGFVYAASAHSGRVLWSRPAGGRVSGAVQIVAGLVYAANLEGGTRAWNWRTGRPAWSFPHGAYVPLSGSGDRLLLHGRTRMWAVESRGRR